MKIQGSASRFLTNPHLRDGSDRSDRASLDEDREAPLEFLSQVPEYRPTPLARFSDLADELGLGSLVVKDESARMGMGSFKVLGVRFAVQRWLAQKERRPSALAAASDGNHGRAVARVAREVGAKAFIYLPEHVPPWRVRQIEQEGASVCIVAGTYDDAIDQMARESGERGYLIVSDYALPGKEDLAASIATGYRALFEEVEQQLVGTGIHELDLVLLQAGVGAFASAGIAHFRSAASRFHPRIVIVEPEQADCLAQSVAAVSAEPAEITGKIVTVMTCLNCGRPSPIAWPLIRREADGFLAIGDTYAERARVLFEQPGGRDPSLLSTESGAAGLAGLLALMEEPAFGPARDAWGLGPATSVLVVNTEGF